MKQSSHQAFSMVEMLVVLAVIGILAAIAVPAVSPLLRATNISHAAIMITDEFNQARQFALTKNKDVEIRFYRLPNSAGEEAFRAFRCFLVEGSDSTKYRPFGKMKTLPETVVISDNTNLSTILDYSNTGRAGLTKNQETIKGYPNPVDYISFNFRPDGGTSLTPVTPPVGNWFLTLFLEKADKDGTTGLPENYCNVQVDPVTGRVRSYRP